MSRYPTRTQRNAGFRTSSVRSAGGLLRGRRSRTGRECLRSAGAGRRGRWLRIASLLAVLVALGSTGVWAEPGAARGGAEREEPEGAAERGRSLSPEARGAAREVYQVQLRLRAAAHDPRRDALWAEIRRAKELVPLALASRGGRSPGLPSSLAAQKQRIQGLLEELRSSYSLEGRPERLAELDRIEGGLRRMFDECESIGGLPHGPARAQKRARLLRELQISKPESPGRLASPMARQVDPRAGRSPGLEHGAEPKVDVFLPSQRQRGKP